MYCAMCGKLSWHIICESCLRNLSFVDSKRVLSNGLKVFSSFALSELQTLLVSKNSVIGSRIFKRLGQYALSQFFASYPELAAPNLASTSDSHDLDSRNLDSLSKQDIAALSIRNKSVGAYSHSAILAQCFRSYGFTPLHNALIIGNNSRFAHLNKAQRQEIGRNFSFQIHKKYCGVILVDDIVTTGQTLLEASQAVIANECVPLFAWTLCDSLY